MPETPWLMDEFILPVKIYCKINPDVILPVKLKFYSQNKSRSYSAGKINPALILPVELSFTGKINPALILQVKPRFAGKINPLILPVKLKFYR